MKVVQCWDDGVTDDVRLIGILRKHGAKASFNLNFAKHPAGGRSSAWTFRDAKEVRRLARGELLAVYDGFTVANHTLDHPFLTRLPPDEAAREVREGRDALEQHFGRAVTGFAYPYGDTSPAVEEIVRAAGHRYARTCGTTERVLPAPNPMNFRPSCHFLDAGFREKYERVRSDGNVFYFWGHSYELVTEEDWRAFDETIGRISEDPLSEWSELPDLFEAESA